MKQITQNLISYLSKQIYLRLTVIIDRYEIYSVTVVLHFLFFDCLTAGRLNLKVCSASFHYLNEIRQNVFMMDPCIPRYMGIQVCEIAKLLYRQIRIEKTRCKGNVVIVETKNIYSMVPCDLPQRLKRHCSFQSRLALR